MAHGESMEVLLAPRIRLYPFGSLVPQVEPGWLALAHLPHHDGEEVVFGDGSHPTTRLCATMVDLLCRQRQPESVLDVGTGTGVLARIARARGAELIVATDIDLGALDCAKAHAELDEHGVSIELSAEEPDHWGARFDLVVANILEAPLRELAPALCRSLAVGGTLLLSGFTRPQTPALRVLYESAGLTFVSESHRDEWALLMFERRI